MLAAHLTAVHAGGTFCFQHVFLRLDVLLLGQLRLHGLLLCLLLEHGLLLNLLLLNELLLLDTVLRLVAVTSLLVALSGKGLLLQLLLVQQLLLVVLLLLREVLLLLVEVAHFKITWLKAFN